MLLTVGQWVIFQSKYPPSFNLYLSVNQSFNKMVLPSKFCQLNLHYFHISNHLLHNSFIVLSLSYFLMYLIERVRVVFSRHWILCFGGCKAFLSFLCRPPFLPWVVFKSKYPPSFNLHLSTNQSFNKMVLLIPPFQLQLHHFHISSHLLYNSFIVLSLSYFLMSLIERVTVVFSRH